MVDGKTKNENRGLIVVLCVLGLVIVGLTISIMIVSSRRGSEVAAYDKNGDLITVDPTLSEDTTREMYRDYEKRIDEAEGDEDKALLLLERAGLLMNAEHNTGVNYGDWIRADVYKAEELHPTVMTAYMIYEYELSHGDEEQGEYYFNLSQERKTDGEKGGMG